MTLGHCLCAKLFPHFGCFKLKAKDALFVHLFVPVFLYIFHRHAKKHKSLHIKSVNIIYKVQKYQVLVRMSVGRAYAGV